MALKNMSLLANATVSATGGTALVFADTANANVVNGVQLIVPSDTDYVTRRTVVAKVRPPVYDKKTNSYGKSKVSLSLTQPKVLADGSVCFQVARQELEMHPTATAADILEMRKLMAQMWIDGDLDAFYTTGSLA